MDPAQKRTLYLKTQQLLVDLNFGGEHPRRLVLEVQEAIKRNNFDPAREYLRVLNDVDPANPTYTALLRKPSLTFPEFRQTMLNFYEDPVYYPRFIDTITRLKSGKEERGVEPSQQKGAQSSTPVPSQPKQAVQPTSQAIQEVPKTEVSAKKPIIPEAKLPPRREGIQQQQLGKIKERVKETSQAEPQQIVPPQRVVTEATPGVIPIQRLTRPSFFLRRPGRSVRPVPGFFLRRVSTPALGGLRRVFQSGPVKNIGSAIARTTRFGTTRAETGLKDLVGNTGSQIREMAGGGSGAGSGGGGVGNSGKSGGGNLSGLNVPGLDRILNGRNGNYRGRFGRAIKKRGFLFYFLLIIALILILGWLFGFFETPTVECDKGGEVDLQKSGPTEVENGKQITYQIVATFKGDCGKADIDVFDEIPQNTKFISANSSFGIGGFSQDIGTSSLIGGLEGNKIVWHLKAVQANQPNYLSFTVEPTGQDIWVVNQASYRARFGTKVRGLYGDVGSLLPSPLPPPAVNWQTIKDQILAAFNKHPELIENYKQAGQATGIPWQILAGLHFVETGSGPGPDSSLVSGRKIGQVEPDVPAFRCANGVNEPGAPIPIAGGCGFRTQLDSAIYAAKHLAEKIGKVPTNFQEAITAMSRYNGGGNANCGEGLTYGPCPPQFPGEDDPYAMSDFDDSHSEAKMFIIFCADRARCNPPKIFGRPGAMAVVRALSEQTP